MRKTLGDVLDLERLLAKVTLGSANPRELLALARSLARVPELKEQLRECGAARLVELCDRLDEVAEARDQVLGGLSDEPPVNFAFSAEQEEFRATVRRFLEEKSSSSVSKAASPSGKPP